MAEMKDFADPTVIAAAAGSLAAAVKRKGHTAIQKVASFIFGFCVSLFVVPYALEKCGVQSVKGYVAFSFLAGYLSDSFFTPLLFYVERSTPFWVDKWLKKKVDE